MANGATEAKEEEEETDGPVVVKERTPPKRIIVAKVGLSVVCSLILTFSSDLLQDDAESKREITIRDEKSLDEIVEARTIRHQRG